MTDLNTLALCTFEDAKAFKKHNLPQILFVGSPVYQIATGYLYRLVSLNEKGGKLVPFNPANAVDFRPVEFKNEEILKAYSLAELNLLLPVEYTASLVNTVRGWAWMGTDGNIITADQAFYKREVDARAKFMLYFLNLTIIELPQIIETWKQNIKLLK